MRLGKHLAHSGVSSRRGAEEIIRAGRVTIDGAVCVDPARDVSGAEDIAVDGTLLGNVPSTIVYALNKPVGVVSTARDTHGRRTVTDLVDDAKRLYPVGRLDIQTSGLILLTNDGELANLLTHPRHEVPKTYRAKVRGGTISAGALRALRDGVVLDDGVTQPARVRKLAGGVVEIELREGRNRQVRRMCEAVGHPVAALERVAIGPLRLGRLHPGGHRRLGQMEIQSLRDCARQG